MSSPKRNRARILAASGLKKLRERIRSHEVEENAGLKYTLERLGELTGLDPETVKNVLDCKGSDKRTIARCFESFGLTLEDSDHISAAQVSAASSDPNFVGRDEAIADLNALVSRNIKVIVIQARGGVGKTTLARKYLQQEFGSFLEFSIAKETKDIASIEGLIEEKLRQLGEEPGREFLVSLDRLKRKLQAERIGILIDNLEPALDSAGRFIEPHRRYVELLRVLSDPTVRSVTLITSRERLREVDVTVQHYGLRSLDGKAWEQFFQSRDINAETPALAALHNAYGGNAKAMDIISGAVLEDYSGDVEAYWRSNQDDLFIERDLEDLVTKQFDRLKLLDLDAYTLLCRMGGYYYQDVQTIPIEGLFCLLWDVPKNRHRRVVKSLQDRSLIDFKNEEFWLHPVIRAEAVLRLRTSKDWEMVDQQAARFWTEKVLSVETIQDALAAFEAYYHYRHIRSYEEACMVLLKERDNKWQKRESLGQSLYRLGLFKQLEFAISSIKEKIKPGYLLARVLITEGTLNRLKGSIYDGIKCCLEARKVATQFEFRRLEISSLGAMGLCKIDLWEIESAYELFEEIRTFTKNNDASGGEISEYLDFYIHPIAYLHCLAFLSSCLNLREQALRFAEQSCQQIEEEEMGTWTLGNSLIFLGLTYTNLNQPTRAFDIYNRAIAFSQESQYLQVQAKALCGIAELYREKKDFENAVLHHLKSIEILERIDARCDLAESYYKLGLTYQMMTESSSNNAEKSNTNFQKAIQLFTDLNAPKQVERVKRSMKDL